MLLSDRLKMMTKQQLLRQISSYEETIERQK